MVRRGEKHQFFVLAVVLFSAVFIVLESKNLQIYYGTTDSINSPRSQSSSYIESSVSNSPPPVPPKRIPRLVNDATLFWNETMKRPWISFFEDNTTPHDPKKHPPYMILLTNVGWNHPNQTHHGLTVPRFTRERELMEGIINHPYFHPTAWEEINNGSMPILGNGNNSATRVNYYVFADVMQCEERNYPVYGGTNWDNLDSLHNRSVDETNLWRKIDNCGAGKKFRLFEHPLFQIMGSDTTTSRGKLVVFNCNGDGPMCGKRENENRISTAAYAGHFPNVKLDRDQGMMPPAVNPIVLTKQEEDAIANCRADTDLHNRPMQAVYVGNFRTGRNAKFHEHHRGGARMSYKSLNNPEAGFLFTQPEGLKKMGTNISIRLQSHAFQNHGSNRNSNDTTVHVLEDISYKKLLRSAKFALAPRGDDKFSYRFTEILSAGAIPVYHGDDYVFPFRPELVDWNKCAIILPEKDAGQTTLDLLAKLDPKTTCAMRQYCYFGIYKIYVDTSTKQIDGLVRGLDAMARRTEGPKHPAGFICNETSIANFDCNPLR